MGDTEQYLVQKLRSTNTSVVYGALVEIRKNYVRNEHKMSKLQKYSVIELIIPFIEHPKFCNVALSIIADGCLELSFVNEVIKYNGINSLIRIMKSMVNHNIRNRACRALGNMAKFEVGFKLVLLMKPVSYIIDFLSETNDADCQQTAIRTLMILGKSSKTRELIAQENGIVCIAKLLHSSDVKVLNFSTKAIATLTQNCSIFCARQLLESQFLKILVELHSHSEKSVRNHALVSLKNLSSQEEIRSDLVKLGAVKVFTDVLTSCETWEMGRLAALALCSYLDHNHMWSHNGTDRAVGLKALLNVLGNTHFQDIHIHIIASLIPLSYESKVSDILLNLDIIHILIEMLDIFIEKHKCKCNEYSKIEASKEIKNVNSYESDFRASMFLNKPQENCSPKVAKKDHLLHNFSSTTDNYSGTCIPFRICTPVQNLSASPEFNYEVDVSSPSTIHDTSSGTWSPVSLSEEDMPYVSCWSPIVSTHFDSIQNAFIDNQELREKSGTSDVEETYFDESMETSMDCNLSPLHKSYSINKEKQVSCLKNKMNPNNLFIHPQSQVKRKKVEIEDIHLKNTNSDAKYISNDNTKLCSYKQLNDNRTQTIDHYVIFFILQLSFHIEKKTNSQIADKACFSVLIDYICFIRNHSPKAEAILLNLIKNRYCLEKLILNGFVSELEEKMKSLNHSCIHRSCVKPFYSQLINMGRQEVESDYGIGTLSHILVTSEKTGQFRAICAMSKLVTEKAALFRLLFQANGLSLLFYFLSENNISTRKEAVLSLCEIYQSLTIEQKTEKCCLDGTCSMEISSKCYYKESFLDITFSVIGGVKILANREKICKNSEYFSALLQGHFLESNAELVTLPSISAETLSTIFHFLHGCGSENCCPYIKRIPFSVLLELLTHCEKFLLMNIKAFVEDRLCHCLIPSTVSKIYRQSKIHNSPELTKKALDFALSIDTLQKDQLWNCFEELMNLESNLDFLDDVKSLLQSVF